MTLLDAVYAAEREPDALAHQRAALLARIEPQRKALHRKIASLESGLVSPERLAALRTQGEMVLAYQHSIEQGQRELTIPELDLTIPLDPKLNPLENAQRLFKSYQKARDAAAVVPGLIEAAQQERDYLDQLAVHAELAADPASLAAVREEFREATTPAETVSKKSKKQDKRKAQSRSGKEQARAAPLRLRAADGTEILIGRSARQREGHRVILARAASGGASGLP